ncbi:MAG: AzlC family ABC transporter permease [Coriobacteriia bacterium]
MSTPLFQQHSCPTRIARLGRGMRLGFPILLGYVPVGMAFGILATSEGFTITQAVLCSATALAGAGQFIALALMTAGSSAFGVLVATTVVNLRYVLFAATLSPHLSRTPLIGQGALAFSLTDETFAVNIDDLRRGTADGLSMAGVGIVSWIGWVSGTAVGAAASAVVGDPSRFGAEFAMAAMFIALLVAQAEDRKHVTVGIAAAALAVLFALVLPGKWYIVAAAIGAATFGAWAYR